MDFSVHIVIIFEHYTLLISFSFISSYLKCFTRTVRLFFGEFHKSNYRNDSFSRFSQTLQLIAEIVKITHHQLGISNTALST
jgi:hypothetical protein